MPEIAFRIVTPPTTGVRGSNSQDVTWSTGGGGGEQTVTITPNRNAVPTNGGVFLTATSAGFDDESDPDFNEWYDVRFLWSFDDPGYYTRLDSDDLPWDRVYDVDGTMVVVRGHYVFHYTTGALIETGDGSVIPMIPTGSSVTFLGYDKDIAYGPQCSHVWDTPGVKTVTCTAQKRGFDAVSTTVDITVADLSPSIATICVHPTGDTGTPGDSEWDGAPSGATLVNTIEEAQAACNALSSSASRRIMLARGQTHNFGLHTHTLDYTSKTGDFSADEYLTGGTSTAMAWIVDVDDNGDGSGTLLVGLPYAYRNPDKTPGWPIQVAETITSPGGGSATVGSITEASFVDFSPGTNSAPITELTAYGTGTPPQLFSTYGNITLRASGSGEILLNGIDRNGLFNPDQPLEDIYRGANGYDCSNARHLSVSDASISGFNSLIMPGNRQHIYLSNFHGYDWQNYGMFVQRVMNTLSWAGVDMRQHPSAAHNSYKGDELPPYGCDHPGLRITHSAGTIAMNLVDVRSHNNWGPLAYQPNLRIFRTVITDAEGDNIIPKLWLDRVRGENSNTIFSAESTKPGNGRTPRLIGCDKVYSVYQNKGGSPISSPGSGMMVRNSIITLVNAPAFRVIPVTIWCSIGNASATDPDDPRLAVYGWAIYCNSFAEFRNLENCTRSGGGVEPTPFIDEDDPKWDLIAFRRVENNSIIRTEPSHPLYDVSDNLDMTPLWATDNPGVIYAEPGEEPFTLQTEFATPAGSAPNLMPLPGSPAIGSANTAQKVPLDDFFGIIRPATAPSRCAIEPPQTTIGA